MPGSPREGRGWFRTLANTIGSLAIIAGAVLAIMDRLPDRPSPARDYFIVLSVDHDEGPDGQYFNFRVSDVSRLIGREGWAEVTLEIRQLRTGHQEPARLWSRKSGNSLGNGHGRWVEAPTSGQWRTGDTIQVIEVR